MSDSNNSDSNNAEVDAETTPAADGFAAKQKAAAEGGGDEPYDPRGDQPPYGEDDQDYVDRSAVDFDPADGLYAGTAVDGSTKIPGDHPDLEERGVEYHVDEPDGTEGNDNDRSHPGNARPMPGPDGVG